MRSTVTGVGKIVVKFSDQNLQETFSFAFLCSKSETEREIKMNNNVAKVVLLSLALGVFAAALYVYRPVQNKSTRVAVTGEAQAKVSPDTAVVTFSVVTQNAQALTAQQENARKSEAVKAAVEALGASEKIEVKTSDYNLSPEQDYSSSGRLPKILGYTVNNTVTVSIKDLSRVGAVIDAATKAGANSIESTRFVVREDNPAQGDALALATKQARAKADAIAESLNGRIVRVVEANEGGIPVQPPPLSYSSNAASMSNAGFTDAKAAYRTPVEAGSQNIRSQIVLVVEIEVEKIKSQL